MTLTPDESLISLSDIADLAGASRSAVSNWRRRHTDFPKEVGGSPVKPLFRMSDIQDWLVAHGRSGLAVDYSNKVWALFNRYRGDFPVETLVCMTSSLYALRHVLETSNTGAASLWRDLTQADSETVLHRHSEAIQWIGEYVGSEVQASMKLGDWDSDKVRAFITDALRVVDSTPREHAAVTVRDLLNRYDQSYSRGQGTDFSGGRIARLLAALVGITSGTVYDPASGTAQALLAIQANNPQASLRLVGQEINETARRVASHALILNDADAHLYGGDTLLNDKFAGNADVVVAEPPLSLRWDPTRVANDPRWVFGQPSSFNADLAWVQHTIAHLTEEGRGYVVLANGSLFRGGQEARIRAEMLRQGCVDAIVTLPSGMFSTTSLPAALWVVNRPGQSTDPNSVLLADVGSSDLLPEENITAWMDQWYQSAEPGSEAPSIRVPIVDLISDGANLNPSRWIEEATTPDIEEVIDTLYKNQNLITQILDLLGSVRDELNPEVGGPTTSRRLVTVGELVKQGVASERKGSAPPEERWGRIGQTKVIVSGDLKEPLEPSARLNLVGEELDGVYDLTEPGDIILNSTLPMRAIVDRVGGNVVSKPLTRLRVDQNQFDPGYVAAALSGAWNRRFAQGGTIQRVPLREREIPMLPLVDQMNVNSAIIETRNIELLALHLASVASEMSGSMIDIVHLGGSLGTKWDADGEESE